MSDEMANIKKVLSGLSTCTKTTPGCEPCPYRKLPEEQDCATALMKDALELLKVQYDAMKPIDIRKWHDDYVGDCPSCGRVVRFAQRYCHNCTRLLDWVEVMEFPTEEDDDEVDDKTTASDEISGELKK